MSELEFKKHLEQTNALHDAAPLLKIVAEKLVKEFDSIQCMLGGKELIELAKAALKLSNQGIQNE